MPNLCENAKFICTDTPKSQQSPVFRRTFIPKKTIASAELNITARGIYEARINGKTVSDFFFAPGFTAYQKRLQVQCYDVTAAIQQGENTVDLLIAMGWHYGPSQFGKYNSIDVNAVIASLVITYEDGEVEEFVTDEAWQYSMTPILYSDLYHGEIYDANIAYGDWKPAVAFEGTRSTFIFQEGERVCEQERLPAKELIITPKGEKVLDFGQEITGYVYFRTVGKKGDRTVLDCAEVLDAEGNFYRENYRAARSQMTYVTNGDEAAWWHPHFSFYGFRYIRLTEYPLEDVDIADFIAVVVHSDMKRTGYFECSDPLVNRLYENTVWGQKGNYLDIPTDCPQRDERQGWTGDAQVFCRAAAYHYDVYKFMRKWLHDLAADQGVNGSVGITVPRVCGDTVHSMNAWGDAATVCPWEIYRAYGKKEILEEQFDSMRRWVDFLKSKGIDPAGWVEGNTVGDWLGLDAFEGSYRGATNFQLIATAFTYHSTTLLLKAARALGREMPEYEAFREAVRQKFHDEYVGDDGLLRPELNCNTQTAYVLALRFDLVDDKKCYADHLAEMIRENDNHLKTGFVGTPYIMDALSENGHADVAYSLLLQKTFPSWLYSVLKGATTIWEHWDGIKPDGSMWSKDMNSFNHYAYGAVAAWMYGTMAGINPDEEKPGYEHIIIRPIVDERLDYVRASIETKYGTVKSGWEKSENGGYLLTVTIPKGTTATVTFGGKTACVTEGTHTFKAEK